jgi:hypothetical protein
LFEKDGLGNFESGQPFLAISDDFRFGDPYSGLQYDDRLDRLTPPFIRNADYRRVLNPRDLVNHFLHFHRIHIDTDGNYHILGPVDDIVISLAS